MKSRIKMKNVNGITIFESMRVMDIEYVEELKEKLPDLMEKGNRFIFNFEHTDIFCSTALGVLVSMKKQSHAKGGDTRLCNVNYTLNQILEHTRLLGVFDVYESEKEAIESFKKTRTA